MERTHDRPSPVLHPHVAHRRTDAGLVPDGVDRCDDWGGGVVSRIIAWFSSGAASAVMTKLALSENPEVTPVQCDLGDSEDEDNRRFTRDCEAWFGKPVLRIKSERFANIDEVFEGRKYHAGINGAPCTSELKVAPRLNFQLPSDTHLWGYTADGGDIIRWKRMQESYPLANQRAPLIERGLTKEACLAMIERAGIKPPRVYALGFPNANCIGCVKATSPNYWALVRQTHPEVFARRADQSRRFGSHLVRINDERRFLDELPADWPATEATAPGATSFATSRNRTLRHDPLSPSRVV